jgi:hypothetical protein
MADVAAGVTSDVAPAAIAVNGTSDAETSTSHAPEAPDGPQAPQSEDETGAFAISDAAANGGCTQAQLRRFIKSRPYVPMHELRRRFELNGSADDVSAIPSPQGNVYVGLPTRESQFIAELARIGEIGLELSYDPPVPVVVGVYAMRPVSR